MTVVPRKNELEAEFEADPTTIALVAVPNVQMAFFSLKSLFIANVACFFAKK